MVSISGRAKKNRWADALFVRSILASNIARLSHPFKLSYAITYRCNMRCAMCNIWKKTGAQNEMTLSDIDRFFAHANKPYWVGITGGEPFLRDDVQEITSIVMRHCTNLRSIHFATNGTYGDRVVATVEHIHRHHPNLQLVFTISIDGPQEQHDRIRGREGTWDKAIGTFKRLKKMSNVKVQLGFTVSSENVGTFGQTYDSLKEAWPALAFDDINVNVFQQSAFYYENTTIDRPDSEKLLLEIDRILSMDRDPWTINNFLRRNYLRLYKKYIATQKSPLKCQSLASTCFVDPAGDLYPCAIYKRKLLNVKDLAEPLANAWSTPAARQLADQCARHQCPGCWSPCDAFSAIGGSLIQTILSR